MIGHTDGNILLSTIYMYNHTAGYVNPCPAEPEYTLSYQTVLIQISWFMKKPTDLDTTTIQIFNATRQLSHIEAAPLIWICTVCH